MPLFKTAPTVLPDASDLTRTGSLGSYTLRTRADIKASFSALKAVCYLSPNLNDFWLHKTSIRGAASLADP